MGNIPPDNVEFSKAQDPDTMAPSKNKDQPLEGGNSTQIGGMWTLKHVIISQKLYELITKTELKCNTALYLNNFYNHINIFLDVVIII